MRKSVKRGIAAAAVAASALGVGAGLAATAGPASAATVSTTAAVVKPAQAPALGTWNRMTVTLNGTTYTGYWLLLQQHRDGLLTGWLYDPNSDTEGVPGYLAVHGSVSGDVAVFEVSYPTGDPQGVRAFVGTISGGTVSGSWTETGSEGGTGTWSA
jgi:hypothetical protein